MRSSVRLLFMAAVAAVALLGPVPLAAAQTTPQHFAIRGVVLDSSRAAIVGARVEASSPSEPRPVSTTTDQMGAFALEVSGREYTLRIMADGFSTLEQRVTARTSMAAPTEFVLQLPGIRESVSVTGASGYQAAVINSATRTPTPLVDVPQSVTVITNRLVQDQLMMSVGDAIRYVPGVGVHQGENNRDQVIIRGNSSSADFFVNGVRDDVQYYRDLYNMDRMEALKGPNAMIFGRGGGGGVVNRVTKEALFAPVREVTLQGGGYGNKRFTTDLDQPFSSTMAGRLNVMFENSDSFRTLVDVERFAINPTMTLSPSDRTRVVLGYEYLRDRRVADRGITSYRGAPADVPIATFYGNPDDSHVRSDVHMVSGVVEHRAGAATIRNRSLFADYGRFYQNYVPGAASADKAQVTLTAYNNATDRANVFNQTDLTYIAKTGAIRHTLLAGAEFGRQLTDNFRNTGFFNNTATSILAPYANPTISTPVTYRQSATDADNHLVAKVAAAYAQDQVELTRHVQVLGGVRFDHFSLAYHNNRNGDQLNRPDNLVSPRAGVIVKPREPMSIYGSYSVSYLPSSGDQFSSLTNITQQVEPERFTNYEVGFKWDVHPALSFLTSVYRLDRTNTRATDPNDPTRIVQTGSQRTNGFELGVNGRVMRHWSIAGGYAYQDAYVTSATAAARVGAVVGQVPHNTFSLWNNYDIHPRVSAALGILYRSDMFATIDNSVAVPGYTRADVAAYFRISKELRLQVNIENLTNVTYYINADSNTNISPGFPRTARVALVTTF